jgi:Sulfotransferase family
MTRPFRPRQRRWGGGGSIITSFLFLSSIYLVSVSTVLKWHYITTTRSVDEIHNDHQVHHVQQNVTIQSLVSHSSRSSSEDLHANNNNTKNRLSLQEIMSKHRVLPESEPKVMSYMDAPDVEFLKNELLNKSKVYWPGPYDGAGIVIEEYRLVFFTQGKVACTVFKQLLRRMVKLDDWHVHKEPNIPHNPKRNSLTYLYHYSPDDALTILTSPQWTRAMFVRDPKERMLSAYLDKAAKKNGIYIRRHCCSDTSRGDNNETGGNSCFEKAHNSFLGFLQVVQESCCCDPHWSPQSTRIDPPVFRKYINFVGHFEDIQNETKRLLDHLDAKLLQGEARPKKSLWEQFGTDGWGPNGNAPIFSEGTKAKHETSAITKLREYYNSTSERLLEDIYQDDYHDTLLDFKQLKIVM